MNKEFKVKKELVEELSDNYYSEETNFSEIWNYIKKGKKIIILTTIITFSYALSYSLAKRILRPIYKGSFQLLINDPFKDSNSTVSDNQFLQSFQQAQSNNYDLPTLKALLKSPSFLKDQAEELNYIPSELSRLIRIKQLRKEGQKIKGVLDISIENNDPKEGMKILKGLSNFYIDYAFNKKKLKSKNAIEFVNDQTPRTFSENVKARDAISTFQEKYSLIDPQLKSEEIKNQEYDLSLKKFELEKESKRLKELIEGINDGNFFTRGFTSNISSDQNNQNINIETKDQPILNKYFKAKEDLAKASSKYTPQSKVIKSLEKRIELLKPKLTEAQLNASKSALELNNNSLKIIAQKQKDLNDRYLELPELNKEFTNLKINLEISEKKLVELYAAKEKFLLDLAQARSPWSIFKQPQIGKTPVKPNFPKNLFLGIFFGIFFGSIICVLREKFNNVYKTSKSINEVTGITVIGEMPYVSKFQNFRNKNIEIFNEVESLADNQGESSYERFFYQESLRNIYTSIRFLNVDNDIKSIALTSSTPSEGKSLINLLLAKTLTELGLKVLLVDADLRKPQLHMRLNCNNFRGLSNLLVDKSVKINDVIQEVKGCDNLSLIPSGIIPPNPILLLGSERMSEITKEIRDNKNYDYIFYDTPPLQGLSDALLIGEYMDGFIFLSSLGNTRKDIVNDSIKKLQSNKMNLLGLITNFTKKSNYKQAISENEYLYKNNYANYGNFDSKNDNKENQEETKFKIFLKYIISIKDKIIDWVDN